MRKNIPECLRNFKKADVLLQYGELRRAYQTPYLERRSRLAAFLLLLVTEKAYFVSKRDKGGAKDEKHF